MTSCNKWLDVDSSANILEETLFEDYEGYRTAVNGVYRLLSAPELYGQNLTWGVASVLGNNYDATRLSSTYVPMAEGDYVNTYSIGLIDPIWAQGYKVIANCNNIIQYAEIQDSTLFPETSVERNIILGEMIGVRAMMHFDLLRLFAPATKVDDGQTYIPYITVFPDRQPEHLKVVNVLNNVITDLERAITLLAYCDTTVHPALSYSTRLSASGTNFFGARGTRMNYFAASAILARAYQWRNESGDMERAYKAALAVYRFYDVKAWYQFTPEANLTGVPENIFRKMPHDILLAFFNTKMYTIVSDASNLTQGLSFVYKNDVHLFSGDLDDYRLNLINVADESTIAKTSRRWSIPTQTGTSTADVIRIQGPLAPVVRLSEIMYIMCEYLSETDLPQAIELLEKVRIGRGAKRRLDPALTKEDFLKELYIDMTREFMSEGQTFYLYKRLNEPIYNGEFPLDMEGRYVLPLPYNETAYFN
jgi:hypothetical protein